MNERLAALRAVVPYGDNDASFIHRAAAEGFTTLGPRLVRDHAFPGKWRSADLKKQPISFLLAALEALMAMDLMRTGD